MKARLLLVLVLLTKVEAEEPHEIVRKSLPFLKEKGVAWIEDRACASCHQVPSMLWSLNLAAAAGLDPERKESLEWTPWSADWRHWNQTGDKDGVDKVSAANIDTMNFLLLGRDRSVNPAPAWVGEFRLQILKNQQADGSWKAGGQLPLGKRPDRETHEVTTMWTLLALESLGDAGPPAEAKEKAASYLAAAAPGKSTEWHAARLLLDPGDTAVKRALLDLQSESGGWGWLSSDAGDAFGTGLALYALSKTGLEESDPARTRAIAFLKSTQGEDGSWPVPSTRAKDQDKINRTATYWGTAWAVIGLLETYGDPSTHPNE